MSSQEPNIGQTCAELLVRQVEIQQRMIQTFLELADAAYASGVDADILSDLAKKIPLHVCIWCKESGAYPSQYFKSDNQFLNNGRDNDLNGKICDECLISFVKNETKKL